MLSSKLARAWGISIRSSLFAATALVGLAVAGDASAAVRFEGTWPEGEAPLAVDVTGTRDEVVRAVSAKAGWGLVMEQLGGDQRLTVRVDGASSKELLEATLGDGDWVAKRSGALVTITRAPSASAAPTSVARDPGASDPGPSDKRRERDVEVFGNDLRIAEDETVRNVTVMGGSVEIEGHVTGNLSVLGGSAHLHSGAIVDGDASVTGGSIAVDPGARIDGNLGVLGGSIEGAENAKVGGSVKLDPSDGKDSASFLKRTGRSIADGLRSAALLFLLGVLFIALGGDRSEMLRAELAARPMKSLALGVVGSFAATVVLLGLCLTVIGIPVAFVAGLLAIVLLFAGTTSALTVAGAAATGHRSKNVYVHLAAGCAMFFVLVLLPWVGHMVQLAVVVAGIGAVVATRAAGYALRWKRGGAPYRDPNA